MDDEEIDEDSQKHETLEKEEKEEEQSHESKYEDSPRSDTRTPSRRIQTNHPETLIIGDKDAGVQITRQLIFEEQELPSLVERKAFEEARKGDDWIISMNDELNQIDKIQTWELVPRPKGINFIGTKWVFKNKFNEVGQVIRNKAKLLCKGYAQVEGVEFEETFAHVARLEAIRMFLAFACYKNFKVCQMDVKSMFLNG